MQYSCVYAPLLTALTFSTLSLLYVINLHVAIMELQGFKILLLHHDRAAALRTASVFGAATFALSFKKLRYVNY